jgi:hypothetical protein
MMTTRAAAKLKEVVEKQGRNGKWRPVQLVTSGCFSIE